MLRYVKNYPPKYVERLKEEWISTAKFLAFSGPLLWIVIYFTIFRSFDLLLAVEVSAFLILFSTVSVAGSISNTIHVRHVRIVPILARNKPDAYRKVEAAAAYRENQERGKAIARRYKPLVAYAEQQGFKPISEFGEEKVYSRDIQYFDPNDALEPVQQLVEYITQNQERIEQAEALIQDLSEVEAILMAASENEIQFCFAIM